MSVISTAATMRVLNVVRHWVSKFAEVCEQLLPRHGALWHCTGLLLLQDIEGDQQLYKDVENLLEDLVCSQNLIPADHKAVLQILRQFKTNTLTEPKIDLNVLLKPQTIPSQENFDTISAIDLAEQLTYIDHHIFRSIRSECVSICLFFQVTNRSFVNIAVTAFRELLEQAWMKNDKETKAIHVLYVSSQFNHVRGAFAVLLVTVVRLVCNNMDVVRLQISRLVVSEIVRRTDLANRVFTIEKWVAIADICRCMQNYNGVLQICAALVNSSVYRLKRTWEKLPKQTHQMMERLQNLVSSDGRFKNMREALHRHETLSRMSLHVEHLA